MCGICGVVQVGGEPRMVLPPGVLERMTDVLAHRGPDDRGLFAEPGIALGVRRLSIVDVDGGRQPVSDESGSVWAAQNGELYNHDDLREQLRSDGHTFRTRCDTEVLPHLYETVGTAFPERLRGKFAIAVWDGRRRRAILARDRLGIKPLYWARRGDLLVFASEMKSLLASGLIETELDYEALDAYLTLGFVPGPRTPLARVSKLDPGCRIVVDGDGERVERYWSFPVPAPVERDAGEHATRLLEILEESVRLRLMSDVPLGAMLSGGLDSSLVVALMARHMSEPVKTFSIGFREAGAENELEHARQVARVLGTDHHELELSFTEQTVSLDELVWHLDEPLADLSALGFLALSELAARHVTVALSGQGADELLGGYRNHRAAALAGSFARLPLAARVGALALARIGPSGLRRAARRLEVNDPAEALVAATGGVGGELRRELLRGPLAELDGGAARRTLLDRLDGLDVGPLPSALFLDAQVGLVDDMLHYFDRASMAHSLEVRVPFLDHELVEYCATIPAELKVRRLEGKHILKRAARGIIPDSVIDRPKVGFFNAAVDAWFRAQTRGAISEYLLRPDPRYADLLERSSVERLVVDHGNGRGHGSGRVLLSILMLEVWLTDYLPRATVAPTPAREEIRVPV
jgi:asparagine synthase (glutamine-hydrolysing)